MPKNKQNYFAFLELEKAGGKKSYGEPREQPGPAIGRRQDRSPGALAIVYDRGRGESRVVQTLEIDVENLDVAADARGMTRSGLARYMIKAYLHRSGGTMTGEERTVS